MDDNIISISKYVLWFRMCLWIFLSEKLDELAKAFRTIGNPRIMLSVTRAKIGGCRLWIFPIECFFVKIQYDLLVLRFRGRFLCPSQRTTAC
jgi:hypothetical protein